MDLTNMTQIDISHCGICGTDIHVLRSGWAPTEYPVVVSQWSTSYRL